MKITHWTDKEVGGLFAHYEKMFSDLEEKKIHYLEIGVYKGGSIEWANKFFKKGNIVGADNVLLPDVEDLKSNSVSLCNADQTNIDSLSELGKFGGIDGFDIIIDDASHIAKLTKQTFDILWKHVKNGGWYIIEDWSAGYFSDQEIYKKHEGMVELIADILVKRKELGFGEVKIIFDKKSFAGFKKL